MKRLLFGICFIAFFNSCKKSEVAINEIITNLSLSPKTIEADGTSIIEFFCELNTDATIDKREVTFKINTGQFTENNTQTLTKKADFENGRLIIKSKILVPLRPGTLTLTAEPNLPEIKKDYIVTDSIILSRSLPNQIKLSASSFAVGSNFQSEVIITGTITNSSGRKVSLNHKVFFEDYFINNTPVNGRYRETFVTSNNDSKVGTIYSPGTVPIGTNIYLKATILNDLGQLTGIKDSVLINVNY